MKCNQCKKEVKYILKHSKQCEECFTNDSLLGIGGWKCDICNKVYPPWVSKCNCKQTKSNTSSKFYDFDGIY